MKILLSSIMFLVTGCAALTTPPGDPEQERRRHEAEALYARKSRCAEAIKLIAEGDESGWERDHCANLTVSLDEYAARARTKHENAVRAEEIKRDEAKETAAVDAKRAATNATLTGKCEGAHMGVNDTWVGGRRRLRDGWVESCNPTEAEIAAMPETAKRRLTEAEKQKIRADGREHYEVIREELEADAAKRARERAQPTTFEVTGVRR